MSKTGLGRQDRKTIKITEDLDEYKRIQYSLKLALRLVNAYFSDFQATQYN